MKVTKTLGQTQSAGRQRILQPQDLNHPAAPAHALADMQHKSFGCEASRQRHPKIGRAPAEPLHPEGRMAVLGHRLGRNATDLLQRLSPDDGTGPAEERTTPEIIALLDQAVEKQILVRHPAAGDQIPLEGVGRIEMMRGLHHAEVTVPQHPSDRQLQESPCRHMVAVEDDDVLAIRLLQRIVDITGLGALVVGASDVAGPDVLGEMPEILRGGRHPAGRRSACRRPVQCQGGEDGRLHDLQWLVVARDEDIDRRP